MKAGEKVKWKAHFNQLIARPIPESEFPHLAKRMLDDGLIGVLTLQGVRWYSGRYMILKSHVRECWSLTAGQMRRFERWVYMNDPFIGILEEE
jgi:hypothetical protein